MMTPRLGLKHEVADSEHFLSPGGRNIHILPTGRNISTDAVETELWAIASKLNMYFALLEGSGIENKRDLLARLEELYQFPRRNPDRPNWDSANDWLGDLSWITGWPDHKNVNGFILLYDNPTRLFHSDPVALAIFMNIVASAIVSFKEEGLAFNLVIGALENEAIPFIHVLKASDFICPICGWDQE